MTPSAVGTLRCLFVLVLALHLSQQQQGDQCVPVKTIDFPNAKVLRDQPFFFNLLPRSPENELLDNVCSTFFPLPDGPDTFIYYESYVYCDGSNSILSFITVGDGKGTFYEASPLRTTTFYFFGYAGCDTYLAYMCPQFGQTLPPGIAGITSNCKPVGLSCLRKIDEIIEGAGLPKQDFYVLPNKLPNRCVTQQLCTIPPNPFYNKLGPSVGRV